MTIDAARAHLSVREVELPLRHRSTGRNLRGFVHRGKQLRDTLLRLRPARTELSGAAAAARGLEGGRHQRPRRCSGRGSRGRRRPVERPERGFRAHLVSGRTTGILKLVGIPAVGFVATRKLSGALLVGLAANALNQLDTRPGRALKAYLAACSPARGSGWSRRPPAPLRSS